MNTLLQLQVTFADHPIWKYTPPQESPCEDFSVELDFEPVYEDSDHQLIISTFTSPFFHRTRLCYEMPFLSPNKFSQIKNILPDELLIARVSGTGCFIQSRKQGSRLFYLHWWASINLVAVFLLIPLYLNLAISRYLRSSRTGDLPYIYIYIASFSVKVTNTTPLLFLLGSTSTGLIFGISSPHKTRVACTSLMIYLGKVVLSIYNSLWYSYLVLGTGNFLCQSVCLLSISNLRTWPNCYHLGQIVFLAHQI